VGVVRIDIVVFDGFDDLDALGPLEVLRSAQRAGADFQTQLVTRTPQPQVTTSHGLCFVPDATYTPGAELLIVPGGGWVARDDVGAWGEAQRGDWLPLLEQAAADRTVMAGVCTGAMLLAHAGIIGNRRANTHHAAWDDLLATGATLVKERVVDDGDLITSGGITSGIDLALWIVERAADKQLADHVAEQLEYSWIRPSTANS
jgi:transcriptional regulator GlxA family with amidase domain